MHGTDQAEVLNSMREEMAEMSLRIDKLERVAWESGGGSSGSGETNGPGGMGLGGSGRNQG